MQYLYKLCNARKLGEKFFLPCYSIPLVPLKWKRASTQTWELAGFQEKSLKWDFCADTNFSLWVPNDKTSKFTVKLPPLHSCGKFVTPVPRGRPGCHVGLSRPIRSKRDFFYTFFVRFLPGFVWILLPSKEYCGFIL